MFFTTNKNSSYIPVMHNYLNNEMSYLQISHTDISVIAMCYSLDLEWPQKFCANDIVLSLVLLEVGFQILSPFPERLWSPPSLTFHCQMWSGSALSQNPTKMYCPRPKATGPTNHGMKTLRPWTKIKLSSLQVYYLGHSFQWQEADWQAPMNRAHK